MENNKTDLQYDNRRRIVMNDAALYRERMNSQLSLQEWIEQNAAAIDATNDFVTEVL